LKVLAFGYIPLQFGGKQTSGLATGSFELFNSINEIEANVEVFIVATDVLSNRTILSTKVHGCNRRALVMRLFKYPINSIKYLFKITTLYPYWILVNPVKLFFKAILLDKYISELGPDKIHVDGTYGALLSYVSLNSDVSNYILRIHGINGNDTNIPHSNVHFNLEEFISKQEFCKVSFVTDEIKQEWISSYGKGITDKKVIWNGYNEKAFFYEEREFSYDLITFSQLSHRKGQLKVIQAIKELSLEENINLTYLIVGEGEIRSSIVNSITGWEDHFSLLGYQPHDTLRRLISGSRYFILPTSSEGFGKAIIESIAVGCKVIIPQCLPIVGTEIINDINSVLMKDDSIKSIKSVLRECLSNCTVYKRERVAESVNFIDAKSIAKKYVEDVLYI
jgi:glycosyltransferase involved in cell wall biosynthesis